MVKTYDLWTKIAAVKALADLKALKYINQFLNLILENIRYPLIYKSLFIFQEAGQWMEYLAEVYSVLLVCDYKKIYLPTWLMLMGGQDPSPIVIGVQGKSQSSHHILQQSWVGDLSLRLFFKKL